MNEIVSQVQSGSFDLIELFNERTNEIAEIKAAVKRLTSTLPRDKCIDVFVTKLVPAMFAKNVDDWIRDELIELGSHFVQFVTVSTLDTKDQEEVFAAIDNTYIKVVGQLRDSNYPHWDQLWEFLIKLSNEKLHSRQGTGNKLLKEVEVAFRNSSSTEQRLKAYDCWKELINNSSLNMEYMCSAKQLKLLVTPMKAKFSRTPTVIIKRCDTYIYLLEKLQDKATLCLKEFLEFCFGPFDEKNDSERTRQGRSVPEVCCKSTKVLLEIIGHSHDPAAKCLKSDEFQLFKPLITNENFPSFAEILINSVMECCTLLHHCQQNKIINRVIIQCLWQSLLRLIHQSSDEVKKKCCAQINSLLNKVLRHSGQSEFLYLVLGNIVELLVRDKLVDEFKDIVFAIAVHLLWMINFQTCAFLEFYILKFVNSCLDSDNSSRFHKLVSNYFKNNSECQNPNQLSSVWCKCNISVTPENSRSLTWPVRYLHELKDSKTVTSKWIKIFVGCKSEIMKNFVIQGLVTLFLDNPTLGSNVVQFLEHISAAETNPNKDFVTKFMRLVELIVTSPSLSKSDVKKLSSTILCYCHQNLYFYKSDGNDEAIDKLCSCVENIVTIHKEYSVLAELATHLKNGHTKNLEKFAKRLIPFLEALMLNDDNSIANNTRKLIGLLELKENGREPMISATRSLRIMNMTNASPKLGTKAGNFRTSPLASKGKGASPKVKKEPVLSINEDKSSDYVPIDTKVSLNVDNLNKHQKEMLRRRRDDIPALYEDLTRSQTPDMFRSNDETETQTFDALEEIKEEKSLNSLASELSSLFDREKKTEPTPPDTVDKKIESRRKTTPKKLRAEIYNAVQKQLEQSQTTEVNQNVVRSIEDNFKVVDESVQNTEDTPVRKSQRVNRRELDFLPTTSSTQNEEESVKAEVSLEDLLARVDKRVEDSRKNEEVADDNQKKVPVITIQKFVQSSARTRKNPKPMNKPSFKIKLKKRTALVEKKQQTKTENTESVYDFKADEDTPSDKAKNKVKRGKRKIYLDGSDYSTKKRRRVAKKQVSHVTAETSPDQNSNTPTPGPTARCPTPVSTSRCPTPTPVTNNRSSRRCPTPLPTNSALESENSVPTSPSPDSTIKSSVSRRRCPTPVSMISSVPTTCPAPEPKNTSPTPVSTSAEPTPVSTGKRRRCPTPVQTTSSTPEPATVLTNKSSGLRRRPTTPVPDNKNSDPSISPTPETIITVPTPVSTSKSTGIRKRSTTPVPNSENAIPSSDSTPELEKTTSINTDPTPVLTSKSSVSKRRPTTPVPSSSSLPEPKNTSPTNSNPTPVATSKSSVLRKRPPTPVPPISSAPEPENTSPTNSNPTPVASSKSTGLKKRSTTPVPNSENAIPSSDSTPELEKTTSINSDATPALTSKSSVSRRRPSTPVPSSSSLPEPKNTSPAPGSTASNPTPVSTKKRSILKRRYTTSVPSTSSTPEPKNTSPTNSNPTPVVTSKGPVLRKRPPTPVPQISSAPDPDNTSPTNSNPTPVASSKSTGLRKRSTTPVPNSENAITSSDSTPELEKTTSINSDATPALTSKSSVSRRRPTTPVPSSSSLPEPKNTSPFPGSTSSNPTPVSTKKSSILKRRFTTSVPTTSLTPEPENTSPTISNPTPVATSKGSVLRKRPTTPVPNSKNSVSSNSSTPEPKNTSPTPAPTNSSPSPVSNSKRRCTTPVPNDKNSVSPTSLTPDSTSSVPTSSSPSPLGPDDVKTLSVIITPLDQKKESKENTETGKTQAPLHRRSRKQSFETLRCSEDVIESSQATQNNHFTRFQSRSRQNRTLKQQTIDEILATPNKPKQLVTISVILPKETPKKARQSLPEVITQNTDPVVRLERSQSLDNSEQKTTEMASDTETLTLESVTTDEKIQDTDTLTLTPVKPPTPDDLPGSPVTCDTPDRTSELLNNTLDISPISSEQEAPPTPAPIPNRRTARLLRMANSSLQIANSDRKWFGKKPPSPSVCKMKLRKEETLDLLTFSREVPSPMTVPASGILKRKSEDDSGAPVAKRKRVNFSDPAITERKIFIRDSEEFEDQNQTENNTDEEESEEKPETSVLEIEELILNCKEFCDSNFEDSAKGKQALKLLMQNLKVPDVVDVISSPLVDSLVNAVDDRLATPIKEAQNNAVVKQEITQEQIEEHVVKLDCDNMKNLIKNYLTNLEDQERNRFLIDLMSLASNELPVNKEFVNSHAAILQNFVKRMTE
ncbi:mucin-4 [Tribolium castaneum]|uniref:Telomere-associated protein Rif1 N-terminal domain-containing protein n=1 Tax=Tribolium castaneum TaxID=7070 RepID=D6X1U1_TRICA|nr:PREDICTED: mucin-4 [Tribolium castaneum]EFA10163.2 hypothetical protein TcasGA2_TC012353 [Tribolium castaneum]|eukprot:XP_008197689.1 PREDICTED: mucin-4 [Tribolium castaneum]